MLGRFVQTALIVIAAECVLAAGAASLLAWSGVVDVAATARHGPFVAWFLHYTMRQSVRRHASDIIPPALDVTGLAQQGATHYYSGCAPCHGAPGNVPSAIEKHAEPPPPPLYAAFAVWRPRELFWIVKHGVKMTAMPPWPVQARDDEVWAMVAFLLRMPKLDAESYRELAVGADNLPMPAGTTGLPALDETNRAVVANCARCHGFDGRGRDGIFPRLAGQSAEYLLRSLQDFRNGRRLSGFMRPVATGLDDTDMRRVATYFAALQPVATSPAKVQQRSLLLTKQGASIARVGIVSGAIPPCEACHDPASGMRNPAIPNLVHQSETYLKQQLLLFKNGHRNGTEGARSMTRIAQALTRDQIRAVAAYFASLDH